jgi:LAO/AO transport system kinase
MDEKGEGGSELERMMARLRGGDVRALARAVSLVESGSELGAEVKAACRAVGGTALRIGVTGPPGAGKSTLVDQMAGWLRRHGRSVGVLAVDPSSAYTGGALLGDRIRMQGVLEGAGAEGGVYVRSMASRGMMGGLAEATEDVCEVLEAAGRKAILIETVGVGQDEIDVVGVADVTVLVLVPGMGDEVQSLKAGVMEAADVFVVNKCDRGGAELLEGEILAMQGLGGEASGWVAPLVRTVAVTGEGVAGLMDAVERCAAAKRGRRRMQRASGAGSFGVGALRLDHLGVAVRSIGAARGFYESLGMQVSAEETVASEKVRTAMLPVGESRIELLEATEEDSPIGRFLAKRGEGLHHIAVHVEDVDGMLERMKVRGVRVVHDAVQVGAGGHRYFFVHPASTGGVLVEIVGDAVRGEG